MDTEQSRQELWHRLDNESGRAYEAFKVYMYLSPAERTVTAAWREWTENPEANRPSPFFKRWAKESGWADRARARDAHVERIRQKGLEDAIYAEAKRQSRVQERMRGNLSEQLMNYHDKVMSFLEELDPSGMRFSDAVAVTRLYIEHVEKFGTGDEAKREDEWTEDDDEFLNEAAERVRQRRMARDNGGDAPGSEAEGIQGAEGGSEDGEESSEHADDEQD